MHAQDLDAAVDHVVPAIEIVGSRIAGWDVSILDTIAEASSGMFVLGTEPVDPRSVAFESLGFDRTLDTIDSRSHTKTRGSRMTTLEAGFDLSQTDKLLTTTRSVRKRLDLTRPVPRDVIYQCLQIAMQAPSGGNSQPVRWLLVDDPEKRVALAELYRRSYAPYIQMQKAAAESSGATGSRGILDSSDHLAEHLHEVPVHVIPCLLQRLPEGAGVAETAGAYGSILPAVWSFMLALRSRGLGSAWTALHLPCEREASELLGIPDTVTQVALIPVAYYTGADFRPAKRRPVEEVTYVNGWRRRA